MQSAIQLYTVRDVEKPLPEIIADVGDASYDGVEFAHRIHDADRDAVRTALDDADLEAASAHVGIDILENEFDDAVEAANTLGYDDVVVPWLDPEHWESVEAVAATVERLSGLADDLAEEGLTMHYHNHDQEFVETEEGTAFELMADRTEFMLEVDAGWALAGGARPAQRGEGREQSGADPVELLHEHGDRISHVHLKDVDLDSEEAPALGEGDLDIPPVGEAAHEIDADWLVFENDQPRDPAEAIPHGADVLSRHL